MTGLWLKWKTGEVGQSSETCVCQDFNLFPEWSRSEGESLHTLRGLLRATPHFYSEADASPICSSRNHLHLEKNTQTDLKHFWYEVWVLQHFSFAVVFDFASFMSLQFVEIFQVFTALGCVPTPRQLLYVSSHFTRVTLIQFISLNLSNTGAWISYKIQRWLSSTNHGKGYKWDLAHKGALQSCESAPDLFAKIHLWHKHIKEGCQKPSKDLIACINK